MPISIMGITSVSAYICDRCKHVWLPRIKVKEPPIICPKCKSYYWNQPTRQELAKSKLSKFVPEYGTNLKKLKEINKTEDTLERIDWIVYHIFKLLTQKPHTTQELASKLALNYEIINFLLKILVGVHLNPKSKKYEITDKGRTEFKALTHAFSEISTKTDSKPIFSLNRKVP